MRVDGKRGCRPQRDRGVWFLALGCIAVVGFAADGARAEEEVVEVVEVVDGSQAARDAQDALNKAQEQLNKAQAELDAARAKLDLDDDFDITTIPPGMREPTAEEEDDPVDPVDDSVDELEPVGPGFMSDEGSSKKLQWALNEDGSRYFRIALWLQVWTRAMQLNPGTTILDDQETALSKEASLLGTAMWGFVALVS